MRRKKEKANKRKNDRKMTIVLVAVFLIGLGVLLYPTVSNRWNQQTVSRAVASYDAAVVNLKEEDYSAYFQEAENYNQLVSQLGIGTAISAPELLSADYEGTLDLTGTGIMGYITVDKINVQLPIYHGTDAGVLQVAAGHLEGTSLPVGGASTHAVISAHRGLPSALLFTNLDELVEGDTFTITVLDQVLTYQVDQISIVEPNQLENLYVEEGEDFVTLLTCTPYGINSHRLLVRGTRIANAQSHINITAEAYPVDKLIVASVIAVPILVCLLVVVLVSSRRRKSK